MNRDRRPHIDPPPRRTETMSDPTPQRQDCCPMARYVTKASALAAVCAGGMVLLFVARALRADEKPAERPKDAVALFDGKDLSKWQKYPAGGDAGWKLVDGAMEVAGGDIITR